MIHVIQTVGAPGTQTFFVRVGVCPLFEGKKVFCCDVFTNAEKSEIGFSRFLSQKIANAPAQPPLPEGSLDEAANDRDCRET